MRVIVIEDNELDQMILQHFIEEDESLDLRGVYDDAIHAVSLIKTVQPDLIFLDVELPGMTGLEFLNAIKDVPQIIMVTSHSHFALDAFENDVTDFIVKPVSRERFKKAVEKARKMHEWLSLDSVEESHIFIRVERENVKLEVGNIEYIEAMGDYIKIQANGRKYLVKSTMKAIGTKLPAKSLIRIHRSYFININKVDSYNSQEVRIGDRVFPISRNGFVEIKRAIKEN
jgi:DNA-binding LytR/AlgR family response regulator